MTYKTLSDINFSSSIDDKYDNLLLASSSSHFIPLDVNFKMKQIYESYQKSDFDSLFSSIAAFTEELRDEKYCLPLDYSPGSVSTSFLELLKSTQNPTLISLIIPLILAWTCFQNIENDAFAFEAFFDYLMFVIQNHSPDPRFDELERYQLYFYHILNNLLIDSKEMRNIFISKNPIPVFSSIYYNPALYYTIPDVYSFTFHEIINNILVNALRDYNYSNKLPDDHPIIESLSSFYDLCQYKYANFFERTTESEFSFLQMFVSTSEVNLVKFLRNIKIGDYFKEFCHLTRKRIFPFLNKLMNILENYRGFTKETQIAIYEEIIIKINCDQMIDFFDSQKYDDNQRYNNNQKYEDNLLYIKFLNFFLLYNHDQLYLYITKHQTEINKFTKFFSSGHFKLRVQALKLFSTIFSISSDQFPPAFLKDKSNKDFFPIVLDIIEESDPELTLNSLKLFNSMLVNCMKHEKITEFIYDTFASNDVFNIIDNLKYDEDQNQDIIDEIDDILSKVEPIQNIINKIQYQRQLKEQDKMNKFFFDFDIFDSYYSDFDEEEEKLNYQSLYGYNEYCFN